MHVQIDMVDVWHTYIHTDMHTRHKLTDLPTYRLTNLETYRLTDLETYRLTDLQTYRLRDLQA